MGISACIPLRVLCRGSDGRENQEEWSKSASAVAPLPRRIFVNAFELVSVVLVGLSLLLAGQTASARNASDLLAKGIQVAGALESVSDTEARTAHFIDAARRGDLELVKKFVAEGIDVNASNKSGETALMEACAHGHLDVINLLLDHKADIKLRNNLNETALVKAFEGKSALEILSLVDKRGLLNMDEHPRWLQKLIVLGDLEVLKALMSQMPKFREVVISNGGLALAARSGDMAKINYFLEQGANPNEVVEDLGSPLLQCVSSRSLAGAKLLLDRRANVEGPSGQSPLFMAVASGNNEMVKLLIQYGANVNIQIPTDKNTTPLLKSLDSEASSRDEVMDTLLNGGADVNLPNSFGFTPLMAACANGRLEAVKKLLDRGASVSAEPNRGNSGSGASIGGMTALMYAAWAGAKDVVEVLLNHRAEIDRSDAQGYTALLYALERGWDGAAMLLLKKGASLGVRTKNGTNSLVVAARGGAPSLVDEVLKRSTDSEIKSVANLNMAMAEALYNGHGAAAVRLILAGADARCQSSVKEPDGTSTAYNMLMIAAKAGADDAIDELVRRGLPVNAELPDGITALMLALEEGHSDVVRRLIEKGANVHHKTKNGYSTLMSASGGGVLAFISQRLDETENVNGRTSAGLTALHFACKAKRIEACRFLLARGADVNAASSATKDGFQTTPLMIAASIRHDHTILKVLLQSGAQVNWQARDGSTALIAACGNGYPDHAVLLLDKGADPNVALNNGLTPLMIAVNFGSCDKPGPCEDWRRRSRKTVETLLQAGAKINALRPSDGMSALGVVCLTGDDVLAEWLLKKGAEPSVKLNDGRTLVELARSKGNVQVAALIDKWLKQPRR
jgi:ankyrin repeat protein